MTLDRADAIKHLTFVAEPRKIPVVLSPEEVARFLEAAPARRGPVRHRPASESLHMEPPFAILTLNAEKVAQWHIKSE